jgi:hypothetical protein
MKLTFFDQIAMAKEISGLQDAAAILKFKRDINSGGTMFLAGLGREYNRKSRTTNSVANQQYYQLPEDGHRLKEIIYNTGNWTVPLEQIPDEFAWRMMNMANIVGTPTHYFIKGYDEVGLYPTPASAVTNGIELVFSPRHLELTEDDTTSTTSSTTMTVTNGSQTVTNSGTAMTAKMVGQWFQVTDGSDENWYKISAVPDSATLTLENYYQGVSGATKTFRIGQVMDLPEEYLEAPVDFAMMRHWQRRGDKVKTSDSKAMFDIALEGARNAYGQTAETQVINAEPVFRRYSNWRGDPPPGGISA